jgi:hypothetical protein
MKDDIYLHHLRIFEEKVEDIPPSLQAFIGLVSWQVVKPDCRAAG